METSALDSTNIEEAFRKLISEVYISAIKSQVTTSKETPINQGQHLTINTVQKTEIKKSCC
jgi:hypothetical protein